MMVQAMLLLREEAFGRLGHAAKLPHLQILGGRHGVVGFLQSCGG